MLVDVYKMIVLSSGMRIDGSNMDLRRLERAKGQLIVAELVGNRARSSQE